jgi:chemotaxis protein MotB
MADPVKPNLPPIVGEASATQTVATGAAKAAAGGVAKVAAWHTVSLATAAALGLGGGGYYLHRDTKARTQLTEMEQQAGALEDRAKKADLAKEALQAQLDQAKEEMRKPSMELEKAKSDLARLKDISEAERKVLEKKLADQQMSLEKLKATTVPTEQEQKLEDELKRKLADQDVVISRLKDQLKVTVASEILFPSGSAELAPAGADVLRKVAAAANQSQDEVRVEGHTDSDPIAPVLAQYYPTNWELSTARAAVAVRTLQATGMVPAERLAAVGYGDSHPVAPNDTAEGKAKNRRVEIIFKPIPKP